MLLHKTNRPVDKLLVFRIGQLGDSIVALPAIWALRQHFKECEFTLLSDSDSSRRELVPALSVLLGTGVFSDAMEYNVAKRRLSLGKFTSQLALMLKLRLRHFDCVAYLAPSQRKLKQRIRDSWFFRLAGIKQGIGFDGFEDLIYVKPLPMMPREADLLLRRLKASNIPVPPEGMGRLDLNLGRMEEESFQAWLARVRPPVDRQWVAVGPGSKMKSKQWPIENFQKLIGKLLERFKVFPIVFGGKEDFEIGENLVQQWGDGYNAAGEFSIRQSARTLQNCQIYIGNDTGTMHLATTSKVRCLAIFSARDFPGLWYPYGPNHCVERISVSCEGCLLDHCVERKNECTVRIGVDKVFQKASEMLEARQVGESRGKSH